MGGAYLGEPVTFVTQLRVTFNHAIKANPSCQSKQGEFDRYARPIRGAEDMAQEWSQYPEEFVLGVIRDVCLKFKATDENPRISTFRYFDPSIKKAWRQRQEVSDSQQADRKIQEVIAQMQQDYEKGVL